MVSLGLQKGNNMEDETREDRIARRKRNYEKSPVYIGEARNNETREGSRFLTMDLLQPFTTIRGGYNALENNPTLGVIRCVRMISWRSGSVHNAIGEKLDVAIGAVAADY